jgi:branched-chain amino acid transport system permease protein
MKLPCGIYNQNYDQDNALFRTGLQKFLLAAAIVFGLCLPLIADPFLMTIILTTICTIISTLGIQILTGYCGQISSGHSGFVAIGAYGSAILTFKLGLSFWIALPLAVIIAGLIGLLVGLTSIRLKGFYLIISTLAAQVIILYVIIHWTGLTGGSYGLTAPAPKIGNFSFDSPTSYFYIAFAFLLLATYLARNLVRTNVGRAFIAIRDNEIAARVMGINVNAYKLLAFFIGCALAGLGGALIAHARGVLTPDSYTLTDSFWYLGYIIIGGLGTITGAYFGVFFMVILSQGISLILTSLSGAFTGAASLLGPILLFVLGAVMATFLIFEPRGLAHRWTLFKTYYRLWPFSN